MNHTLDPTSITASVSVTAAPPASQQSTADATTPLPPQQAAALTAIGVLMTCGRLFLALAILLLNLITITVFAREKQLRTRGNMLVISLAVTDLIMGVLMLLDVVTWVPGFSERLKTSEEWCLVRMFTLNVCAVASIFNIVMIAADRYLYIVHPFIYQRLVTVEKLAATVVVLWTLATVYSTGLILDSRFEEVMLCDPIEAFSVGYAVYGAVAILVVSFTLTGVLYTLIFCLAISKRRKVGPGFLPGIGTQVHGTWHGFLQQLQVLKQSLAVFLVFVLCWSPHLVMMFAYVIADAPYSVRAPVTMLGFFNSALNFFIYVAFNRDFRSRIKVWARKCRCSCCWSGHAQRAPEVRSWRDSGAGNTSESQQRTAVCCITDGQMSAANN